MKGPEPLPPPTGTHRTHPPQMTPSKACGSLRTCPSGCRVKMWSNVHVGLWGDREALQPEGRGHMAASGRAPASCSETSACELQGRWRSRTSLGTNRWCAQMHAEHHCQLTSAQKAPLGHARLFARISSPHFLLAQVTGVGGRGRFAAATPRGPAAG